MLTLFYQIPITRCINKLTIVIPTQQQAPNISGLPPVLINLTTLLFKPTAIIAKTIKNFDNSLMGLKSDAETPKWTQIVVKMAAQTKYKINIGKARLRLKRLFSSPADCFVFIMAKTKVIGMMAKVRVNLTVTVLSRV